MKHIKTFESFLNEAAAISGHDQDINDGVKDNSDAVKTWDKLSQKERATLINQWEMEDAYPYGQSNSKRNADKITSHYLRKRVQDWNNKAAQG